MTHVWVLPIVTGIVLLAKGLQLTAQAILGIFNLQNQSTTLVLLNSKIH
jgi:hypothetical protein